MLRTLASVVVASLLSPSLAVAVQIHVDANAAPGGDGSAALPLASVQPALDAAQPGDEVIVHAGTYPVTAPLRVTLRATAAAPLVIRAEGPVTLADPAHVIPAWEGIVSVVDAAYVTVRDFRVEGSGFFGIRVEQSDHVTVQDCGTTRSLGSGIYVGRSTAASVRGNDVSACCEGSADITSAQECISIVNTNGFEVDHNVVHDSVRGETGGEGIDIKEGSSNGTVHHNRVHDNVRLGIYVDAWDKLTEHIELFANESFHNSSGLVVASEAGGTVHDVRIHDNLVYENGAIYAPASQYWPYVGGSGISIPGYSDNGPRDTILVYNNTVVRNAGQAGWGLGIEVSTSNVTGLLIRDNLVAENLSSQIDVDSTATVTVLSNLVYPFRGETWMHEVTGDQAIQAGPVLVDSPGLDFRLAGVSPAIDAGAGGPELAATDFDGNARVAGARVDIGAFEFGSAPPVAAAGGSAGAGGSIGTGGNPAGSSAQPAVPVPGDRGGCDCGVVTRHTQAAWLALLALVALRRRAAAASERWRCSRNRRAR
jgi:hypothetical protein